MIYYQTQVSDADSLHFPKDNACFQSVQRQGKAYPLLRNAVSNMWSNMDYLPIYNKISYHNEEQNHSVRFLSVDSHTHTDPSHKLNSCIRP